jgi:hypothetical protein
MASKEPVICSVANNKNLFTTFSAELSKEAEVLFT